MRSTVSIILLASLFLLASLAAGLLIWAGGAQANGHEIRVTHQEAESQRDGIRFFVQASSPNEIDDVRVHFKKIGQVSRSSYRSFEFNEGKVISAETLVPSSSGGQYIPPGTRIEYSFEIRDKAGNKLKTEDVVFIYLDIRFQWLQWPTVDDGLITVFYQEGTGMADRAQIMLDIAGATLERMRPVLGIDPELPLHIVTYSSYQDMRGALPFRSSTTSERLITQGVAFKEERVLLVYGQDRSYKGTTAHEFTHLLVADAAGRATNQVPSWLNEGLAEYANVINSGSYDRALQRAIEDEKLRPLWHLGNFSGTPDEIILGYGQGKSVVEYLIGTYSEAKMVELIRGIKKTFDIDQALELAYGFDQYGLDSEWRLFLGVEPLPRPEAYQPRVTATPEPSPLPSPTPAVLPTDASAATPVAPPVNESTQASPPTESAVEPGPQTDASPNAPTDATGERPAAAPGCGVATRQAGMVAELGILSLLGGPMGILGLVVFRSRRRDRGEEHLPL